MNEFGQRLLLFLRYLDLRPYQFEVEVKLSVSSVSRLVEGKHSANGVTLLKIHAKYPELNLDWLMTGRGKMLYQEVEGLKSNQQWLNRVEERKQLMNQQLSDQMELLKKDLLGFC